MKMRDLEARTGVHRETIRVFLRHGLIPEPFRPKANVADYDESHVRAIIAVRDLQQNSALTMRQIGDTLHGRRGAPRVDAAAFQHLEALVSARVGIDVQPILLATLSDSGPHTIADAAKLEEIGLIEILASTQGPCISITDARLVSIWGEMRKAGFDEEHGFTPEMLSYYFEPADNVAKNEARLFLERTEGRIGEEEAAAMLQIALRQMQDFWGLIRLKRFLFHIHKEPG